MKKITFSILCILFSIAVSAQSVDGLELGSYYSKDQIHVALSHALESTADNGMQVFTCAGSRFYFDFTGAYESNDGLFADAEILDADHTVKFPFGTFKVGDPLVCLLHFRASVQMMNAGESSCILSYLKGNRKLTALVRYDGKKKIVGIKDFGSEKTKKAERTEIGHFYNAVPSVRVGAEFVAAGDTLDKLLALNADVEFNDLPNGICKITTGGHKPAKYLVRYDLNHIVKEILPL